MGYQRRCQPWNPPRGRVLPASWGLGLGQFLHDEHAHHLRAGDEAPLETTLPNFQRQSRNGMCCFHIASNAPLTQELSTFICVARDGHKPVHCERAQQAH
eukprot:1656474-Pleurochrysis_carterae.AAC.1